MPVEDYGIWKGLPVHYEFEDRYEDSRSPHLSLYYHDTAETVPEYDREYRVKHKGNPPNKNKPKEIPGLFRAAINIKSQDRDSRLAYWVNYHLADHPIVENLQGLEPGFHPIDGGEGLDFLRSSLFDIDSGLVLPHDMDGPNNDIIDVLEPEVRQSIEQKAKIYLFGSCFSTKNGIHDVHMNQGNIKRFQNDDGVFQDGGLIIHYKDHWTGVFLAFASQSKITDDETGHAIAPTGKTVTWGEYLRPRVR
jgi:uncharacterized protein YukJ